MAKITLRKNRPDILQHAHEVLDSLSKDKDWDITIEPFKKKRTNAQNSRHWKIMALGAEYVGCSPQEMHDECLCQYYGYDEYEIFGTVKRRPKQRSSGQDTKGFSDFDAWCEQFLCAECGVLLPYEGGE